MPAPAVDSLSDEDVRLILSGWEDLQPEHVDLYVSSGVGRTLIQLERSGFKCTEGDPLLLLFPDPDNLEASMAYLYGGNYALTAGTPGRAPWPHNVLEETPMHLLPPGVDASPPFALGRFINERFPAAVDKTDGTSMNVFYLPDLEVYGRVCAALTGSYQFSRAGPAMAGRADIPLEPLLVRAFVLDKIDGRPRAQPQFTLA